jgi:hypothetical protein
VLDGTIGEKFDEIREDFLLSADGKHLAYAARRNGKWMVVMDGKAGPELDEPPRYLLSMSPDGSRLAYVVEEGKSAWVVVDGKPGERWEWVDNSPPVWSPDSRHVAYRAGNGEGGRVVLDGEAGPHYGWIVGRPAFVDGALEYFAIKDGGMIRCVQRL